MMSSSSSVSPFPLCLDGLENELAITIVTLHNQLVKQRGLSPKVDVNRQTEVEGKVASVVSSVFCSVFGCSPVDRYRDLFEQIAAFATHLSKDHIFADGNKRTTVVISLALLEVSGYKLNATDWDNPEKNEVYRWIQDVVTNGRTEAELAEYLRANTVAL